MKRTRREILGARSSRGRSKAGARPKSPGGSGRLALVEAALQAGLDRLPIAFALFDSRWRLVAWNAALASICGYPESFLARGTRVEAFLRFNAEHGDYGPGKPAPLIRARLALLKGRKPVVREQRLADGRTLRISTRPVPPGHRLVTFEDVTEARLAEQRYEFASRAVNEGIYDWDIASGKIYFSDRVYEATGFSARDFRSPTGWRKRIHPDDLARYDAAIVAHLKRKTERFECDYRFRARDGSWRWARQHGVALRDANGRALRMIGSTGDITELKRTQDDLHRAHRETTEALERQTATAEILKVIASSPSDVQPVFDTIAKSALRLCEGAFSVVTRFDGKEIHLAAFSNVLPEAEDVVRSIWPQRPGPTSTTSRAIEARAMVQIADVLKEPDYGIRGAAEVAHFRSVLAVPMLREGMPVGAITVSRTQPGKFPEQQISLLKTFADQAVIAIENVRLFNETKEALERQTATAEILKVISGSPTDVQPVFNAIAQSAIRLFGSWNAAILMRERGLIQLRAIDGPNIANIEQISRMFPLPFDPDRILSARAIANGRFIEIPDSEASEVPQLAKEMARAGRYRALTFMPLVRGDEALGAIALSNVGTGVKLTDKQVALLRTFADQAVIAIENVRLFNETKEALERQTATAEVLRVISGNPTDTQPVFDAILERASELCDATMGILFRFEDDAFQAIATRIPDPKFAEAFKVPLRPVPGSKTGLGRLMRELRPVHIPDAMEDDAYREGDPLRLESIKGGMRTWLGVPMQKDGQMVGAIVIYRSEPRAFSDQQISLLQTFADQAVIAIENVRLFNETKEALARQAAAAQVLRSISESVSDTAPVFTAILDCCNRLIPSIDYVQVQLIEGSDRVRLVDHRFGQVRGAAPGKQDERRAELMAREAAHFPRPLAGSTLEQALNQGRVVILADTLNGPDTPPGTLVEAQRWGHSYSQITVPLMREGRCIGAIEAFRRQLGGFEAKESSLLESFADQAVIAIENVRLFNETKEALERQTATAEILKVIASSPSDVQPVFDAICRSSIKLVDGFSVAVFRVIDAALHLVSLSSTSPEGDEALRQLFPMPLSEALLLRRPLESGEPEILPDVEGDPDVPPAIRDTARKRGWRSAIRVPLIRGREAIGLISVTRREPGSFSPHQVELMKTFADQAVIAIENVRLFNETKEALERQTATAEILRVIASSPSDVQPVFDAIANAASRLSGRQGVGVWLVEQGKLKLVAGQRGVGLPDVPISTNVIELDRSTAVGRAVLDGADYQIRDIEELSGDFTASHQLAAQYGWRSASGVPMLREGVAVGALALVRPQPGVLGDKEMALLRTFADQAVIAIENVRLFKELQSRTEALQKSVQQLTALGEVGQAISSTLDLETVLQTIVARAVQLTGVDGGSIYEYNEQAEEYRLQAAENLEPELVETVRRTPIRKGDGATGRTAATLEPTQVPDIRDPSYTGSRKDVLERGGYRAVLAVPMLREEHLVGALMIMRKAPGAFAPEVVELLKTFAAQSALAIQNARLFREIAEKSRQLEVASKHKSQFLASMSHELRTPLNAILGFNEMLLGEVYGAVPADMMEPLGDMQASGKHLLRLINNVLDLAKIEAGRMELALSDYSAQDIVENVRATLRPLAESKGLELAVSVPPDLPLACGDPGRLTQCLVNLAGNSLKFTKEGKVEIEVQQKDSMLVYRVADTGIGIAPEKIGSLFTEFKQTDATIASEYGGTGLGLSITKKFIEMHGGRIWVESEVGKGSTFLFEIPVRVAR